MTTLLVPGLHGSGEGHWQRWWLDVDEDARLVEQKDWNYPRLHEWQERLTAAASSARGAILVAHSLGCAAVAHLGRLDRGLDIGGALLVAPADIDDTNWADTGIAAFGPMPLRRLSFPTIVVASRSDPYVSFARAHAFARAWGSRFVDLGNAGHINAASGFGPWPLGLRLADELRRRTHIPGHEPVRPGWRPELPGEVAPPPA